jgi:fatty acid desaturase
MPSADAVTPVDPYAPYRDQLLSTERVRELSQLRPWRVVRDVVLCWLSILGAWTAVALWPRGWVVAIAVVIVTTRYYALFIIGHDGMHKRVLSRASANDLFCDLLVFGPILAIVRLNSFNHLAHHRFLASERDPDRHKHACFDKSTRPEYLAFLTGLRGVLVNARHVFFPESDPDTGRRSRYVGRDIAIIGGWQVLLGGGLTAAIAWWAYPVLWAVPVYLTGLADVVRAFAEHSHPEADRKADKHRLITYVSHPVERLFLAPMKMNFHAAHHLWTSIPYYNLPAADREMRANPNSAGLLWRGSYVAYLIRYFLALPLPECRPQAPSGT